MPRPFLTAKWLNVAAVTFAVEPERLRPYLPAGAEIDELEGAARLSLVAFEFRDTRVLGAKVPRHVDFPEINLRFYIRYGGERGVVFIRELVPRAAIANVARLVYNEPYRRVADDVRRRAARRHRRRPRLAPLRRRLIAPRRRRRGRLPSPPKAAPRTGSPITRSASAGGATGARSSTTSRTRRGRCARSPTSPSTSTSRAVYGPEWAWLGTAEPSHLSLAVGSEVSVFLPTQNA